MSDATLIVVPVLAGLLFLGAFFWWRLRLFDRRFERWGLDHLSRREAGQVLRAARSGPVPTDPGELERATVLVGELLALSRRTARWLIPIGGALILVDLVLLALQPAFGAVLRLLAPVLIVGSQWYERRILTRRLATLTASHAPTAGD